MKETHKYETCLKALQGGATKWEQPVLYICCLLHISRASRIQCCQHGHICLSWLVLKLNQWRISKTSSLNHLQSPIQNEPWQQLLMTFSSRFCVHIVWSGVVPDISSMWCNVMWCDVIGSSYSGHYARCTVYQQVWVLVPSTRPWYETYSQNWDRLLRDLADEFVAASYSLEVMSAIFWSSHDFRHGVNLLALRKTGSILKAPNKEYLQHVTSLQSEKDAKTAIADYDCFHILKLLSWFITKLKNN